MIYKKSFFFILFQLFFISTYCQAGAMTNKPFKYPFYIGGMGGYGSTTWDGLVPSTNNQNSAISLSTPIEVNEGGGVWGIYTGYEFSPYFAIEANYMQYPNAIVLFAPSSLFSFLNDGLTQYSTKTSAVSIMAKLMIIIPNTKLRAFSSLGAANVHREDILSDNWRISPTFSAGFNYPITEHFMGEFCGNYTAGFGESNLNPTISYFPFLYSVTFRLAFRI